jgi:hypothetical protein
MGIVGDMGIVGKRGREGLSVCAAVIRFVQEMGFWRVPSLL